MGPADQQGRIAQPDRIAHIQPPSPSALRRDDVIRGRLISGQPARIHGRVRFQLGIVWTVLVGHRDPSGRGWGLTCSRWKRVEPDGRQDVLVRGARPCQRSHLLGRVPDNDRIRHSGDESSLPPRHSS